MWNPGEQTDCSRLDIYSSLIPILAAIIILILFYALYTPSLRTRAIFYGKLFFVHT